jgi:hypothetical protein
MNQVKYELSQPSFEFLLISIFKLFDKKNIYCPILFSEWYFNGDKVATVSGIKHIYTQMNINQKFYDLLNNVNFNGNDFLSLKIYFDKYEDTTPNTNIDNQLYQIAKKI